MDMLFTRDTLVDSLDMETVYQVDEVIGYIDQGINGVLRVIQQHSEPWCLTVDACGIYFDRINN